MDITICRCLKVVPTGLSAIINTTRRQCGVETVDGGLNKGLLFFGPFDKTEQISKNLLDGNFNVILSSTITILITKY